MPHTLPPRHCRLASTLMLLIVATAAANALAAPRELEGAVAQQWSDVRALLRKRCVSCHGPEEQEGGLRLDRGERILQGGDSGKAVVPSKPQESSLLQRVATKDEDLRMPPVDEGSPLSEQEVSLVREWIASGAPWQEEEAEAVTHWAYQPIQRPAAPTTLSQPEWVRNPIDAFVLRKLDSRQIKPAPEADRATMIRRVYLDLLGVPPTPAELDAYLEDQSVDAFDNMVSRALESPHYGERWARHWLDLARYADSDGYEKDRPRPNAWRYRQWVIDALNANMPFDQFTIEQIAGDMIRDNNVSQRIATGFHRNTLHNTEGGTDKEEDRVKKTVDRTNTMGSIWLGLTVGCAQCHSHKYDPITQREYYQLYGFFNDIDERDVPAPTPEEAQRHDEALAKHAKQAAKLREAKDKYVKSELPDAQRAWESQADANATWSPIQWKSAVSRHGAKLQVLDQGVDAGAVLPSGANKASDVYTLTFSAQLPVAAIRLETLPDKRMPKSGPGRAENGNFVLTNVQLTLGEAKEPLAWAGARADFSQQNWEVAKAINDNAEDGWAVSPQFGKRHAAVFVLKEPASANEQLTLTLDQNYPRGDAHNLGKFRITVCSANDAPIDGLPANVASALKVEPDKRSAKQQDAIAEHYATVDAKLLQHNKAIADHEAKKPKGPTAVAQAVLERGAARETRILLRGDFLNPGEPVQRQGLHVLPPIEPRDASDPNARPDRLDLARWLVSIENPLTARVTVNRVWQRYFGRGLVLSVDDFGSQGDKPTHPELLDWLANDFRENHWDLKRLHRLIVSSATYRQSSHGRPDLESIDPNNELLARHPRQRVEAEIVRDLALAVSGLLNPKVGGPSVRPPQPSEYSRLTYANSAKWTTSKDGDQYRRGLYTFFQRTSPYPMLMTFDSPDSTECTARRSESNTPLQALTLWNDVVFFECAQQLGRRIVSETPGAGAAKRVEHAWKLALSQIPSESELQELLEIHQQHESLCKTAETSELQALAGKSPLPTGATAADAAAWVLTSRVLLNLDAFIVKQ